ncbi:MAG: tryptophan--tRNA ligase [Acidobacteriota bacterium]|nr:tryptophan--tRNA ligase [Acidobacteriota bacterium]
MRVFSGIQPTGAMHIGNYLGAIKQWVAMQTAGSVYCVVDLHALTLETEPALRREQTLDAFASLLAAGLDPAIGPVFLQSRVPYHAQMNWLLECVASFGELGRMTQFKEKAERQVGHRVGLFTYPVLMAGDILLYETNQVPVGDDQRQHIELARELAIRFNNRYGETFVVPEAVLPAVGARVMDLQEPTRKMSKSVSSPLGTIYMFDDPADVEKKIMKAVTDTDGEVRYDPELKPGLSNLIEIFSAVSGDAPARIAARYERYGDLKRDVADALNAELAPLSRRYRELREEAGEIERVIDEGAERAGSIAAPVYHRAARAMGLL